MFWDIPAAPWLPIPVLVIHIRSQIKRRQSQSYKFWKIAKNSNFEILHKTLHTTHLLKLLDKMYKYDMDPTRTVGTTERTQDAGRMDGLTDGQSETNIPNNFIGTMVADVCLPACRMGNNITLTVSGAAGCKKKSLDSNRSSLYYYPIETAKSTSDNPGQYSKYKPDLAPWKT